MKTYYLIPGHTIPKFELLQSEIVRLEDTPKATALEAASRLERRLNNGKSQDDIWAAYRTGDFSINPCEAWRVDVLTFAQAADYGNFSQWPCNKDL